MPLARRHTFGGKRDKDNIRSWLRDARDKERKDGCGSAAGYYFEGRDFLNALRCYAAAGDFKETDAMLFLVPFAGLDKERKLIQSTRDPLVRSLLAFRLFCEIAHELPDQSAGHRISKDWDRFADDARKTGDVAFVLILEAMQSHGLALPNRYKSKWNYDHVGEVFMVLYTIRGEGVIDDLARASIRLAQKSKLLPDLWLWSVSKYLRSRDGCGSPQAAAGFNMAIVKAGIVPYPGPENRHDGREWYEEVYASLKAIGKPEKGIEILESHGLMKEAARGMAELGDHDSAASRFIETGDFAEAVESLEVAGEFAEALKVLELCGPANYAITAPSLAVAKEDWEWRRSELMGKLAVSTSLLKEDHEPAEGLALKELELMLALGEITTEEFGRLKPDK